MEYRLLLTDLDGTLLDDNHTISEENKMAVSLFNKKGIKTVICSGRSYMSLEKFNRELNLEGSYGIAYNGGIIYKTDDNSVLFESKLDRRLAFEVIELCRGFDVGIMVYFNASLVIEKVTPMVKDYYEMSKLVPIITDSFQSYITGDVSKVVLKGTNENLKKVFDYVRNNKIYNEIAMFFSSDTLLEFSDKETNKGSALIKLAEMLNIDASQVIAVGDNFNDMDMIEEAGLGVAVENACDELKGSADLILEKSNNAGALLEIYNILYK